jgi:hypothetical protein
MQAAVQSDMYGAHHCMCMSLQMEENNCNLGHECGMSAAVILYVLGVQQCFLPGSINCDAQGQCAKSVASTGLFYQRWGRNAY